MTQDFNSAFLDYARREMPLPPHDPQTIVGEMLRRDEWRTRVLAALCIIFWLAGGSGMLLLVYALNKLVLFLRLAPGLPWNEHLYSATTRPAPQWMLGDWGTTLIHHASPYIAASVLCLILAAIFTVMLVFSSRRVTLTQINLSLMQMAEQLRSMRESTVVK
jgi:hypothetical protein